MSIPTQDMTLTYAGFTISDANKTSYILDDLSFSANYERLQTVITVGIIVKGDTFAEVHSRSTALEDAFRKRRESLTISYGGSTYRSFLASSFTNKNSKSTIDLINDEIFTAKTRRYSATITVPLPPSESNGRTEISVNLSYAANRVRTLTLVTQYNSTTGSTALDNYSADIESYASDVQDEFETGVSWRLSSEDIDSPDIVLNEEITVTRVYIERIKKAEVVYGGFSVGGASTTYDLVNGWSNRIGRLDATVSFTVRVTADTIGALHTACTALENAFRKKRLTLELKYDGSTLRSFTAGVVHADSLGESTGLDNEWFGTPGPDSTIPATRDYSITVNVDMPPESEPLGRTEDTVRVSEDASGILTVEISVQYNSVGASGAKALLDADFATYADSIKTFFGIVDWELIAKPSLESIPIIDNKITLSATYRELIFDQGSGIRDDPELVDFQISVQVGQNYPGDFQQKLFTVTGSSFVQAPGTVSSGESVGDTIVRLLDITTTFSVNVVKTVTDLRAKWEGAIRPYLIEYTKFQSTAPFIAVTDESVTFDPVKNVISGTLSIQGSTKLASVMFASLVANITNNMGKLIVGVHDETEFGRHEVKVKATRIRTITEKLTITDVGAARLPVRDVPKVSSGARWVTTSVEDTIEPKTIGIIPNGSAETIIVVEKSTIEVQEWVTNPKAFAVSG